MQASSVPPGTRASRADLRRLSGATVFAVLELQYTKRGVLKAELAATYNWAPDGELRPLYEYTWTGPPLAPDDAEDDR